VQKATADPIRSDGPEDWIVIGALTSDQGTQVLEDHAGAAAVLAHLLYRAGPRLHRQRGDLVAHGQKFGLTDGKFVECDLGVEAPQPLQCVQALGNGWVLRRHRGVGDSASRRRTERL
jgi:hypothetical protein